MAQKRFEFAEQEPREILPIEPGLAQFLNDRSLRGDASAAERALTLRGKHPASIDSYRELIRPTW